MKTHLSILLACSVLSAASSTPAMATVARVAWSKSLASALRTAKERKAPILVAIHARGTRTSRRLVDVLLRDSRIVKLCGSTVNVFCSDAEKSALKGVSADVQRACLDAVRARVFEVEEKVWIRPQVVLLDGEARVIASVAGDLTVGELEWSLAYGLRKVGSEAVVKLSEAARAPEELQFATKPFVGVPSDAPPTAQEVREALDELGKGGMAALANARETIPRIVWSDDPKAIEFVETALAFLRRERRAGLVELVGQRARPVWWKTIAKHIDDKNEGVRVAVVDALAKLRAPKSFASLSKHARKKGETDAVRRRLLHARVTLKPRDKAVLRAIEKVVDKSKDEKERAHAVLAASIAENRKVITRVLGRALADPSTLVRRTACYAIARRRDRAMRDNLSAVMNVETDGPTKALIEAASKALQEGSLEPFRSVREALRPAPQAR